MTREAYRSIVLALLLLATATSAAAQSYQLVSFPPLPGFQNAEITDVNDFNGTVGNVTSVSAVVSPGRYYVRVRTRNDTGVSAPSTEPIIEVP